MHQFGFERLEIWKLSIDLTVQVYTLTGKFPFTERFGLSNQLRRASNSVSANIAEGSSRHGNKERARYLEIAYGSLLEVMNHLILSARLNFISEEDYSLVRVKLEELSNKINAYHRKLRKSLNQKTNP